MDYATEAAEVVTEVMPWDLDENSVKVRRRLCWIFGSLMSSTACTLTVHTMYRAQGTRRGHGLEFPLIQSFLFNSAIVQLSCHNADYVQFIVLLNEESICRWNFSYGQS